MRPVRFSLIILTIGLLAGAAGLFDGRNATATPAQGGWLSAGGMHTCVLTWQGGAKCWGRNHFGQLGNGVIDYGSSVPGDVVGLDSGLVQVSAGGVHTCAVTTGGGVKCWGGDADGQLGDGQFTTTSLPVDVTGLDSGVTKVFTGFNTTCAIISGGALKCWGAGFGNTPQDVTGLGAVQYVSVGVSFRCALTSAGAVKCWGSNSAGQLGDGQACGATSCATPVTVSGLGSGVVGLTGGEDFTCAKTSAGAVKCWGGNEGGQLGDGYACGTGFCATPVTVAGLGGVTVQSIADDTSSVGLHACVVTTMDLVLCWGFDYYGQVDGLTGATSKPSPVAAPVSGDIAAVAAGGIHTCVQSTNGSVHCWGDDHYGQSASYDGDADGCTDAREFGANPATGGRRDALNPWDFFDPTGDLRHRIDDIEAEVVQFGQDEDRPGSTYDATYDRGSLPGASQWQFGAPDGKIRIFEILGAVYSFGHDCM